MLPKAIARMRRVGGFARGRAQLSVGPAAISLETTVRCNLKCPMCPRTEGDYPQADMPTPMVYQVIEDLAAMGGDYIYLYGLGEPFMDPRLFDIIERCHRVGLGTIVSTNGTFLGPNHRRDLLQSPCDHLIISVDGHSAETYGQYRVGADFDRVRHDILALAREKRAQKSTLTLTIQMVRMRGNLHEARKFKDYWKGVPGVDIVRLKEEELGFDALGLRPPVVQEGMSPCHILWRGPLIVRYTGDVFACHPMANGGECVGHLAKQDLRSIWEGPTLTALRHMHVEGQSHQNAACLRCPIVRPKAAFALGAMAVSGVMAQKVIPIAEGLRVDGRLPFSQG